MIVDVTRNTHEVEATVERFHRRSLEYFDRESNGSSGLVADSNTVGSRSSIAGTGFGLAANLVAAERGGISRAEAARRTLKALRFLTSSPESSEHGFFYHFLHPDTGERAGKCEISTIDSALLFAGALAASQYFDDAGKEEQEIRTLGENLYLNADWSWASPRAPVISHGWTPEKGFLRYDWRGYNEALLLYILALGSPTYSVSASAYDGWLASYKWKSIYGYELLYAGPLFIHQMAHAWIDFRGIADTYMRGRDTDYFENSRRATYVQREYAMRNPRGLAGYGENCWGVSASAGPAKGRFYGYRARGVPFGPDDGTISPLAAAASLPFAPEIVLPAMRHMERTSFASSDETECAPCFNATYSVGDRVWTASHTFAIDEGAVALMLENYRSGLIWNLLKRSPHVRRGLERAGFSGGWLEEG